MGKWRDQVQNLVIETLSDRADGMFRWVFCQLETIRHCFLPNLRRILQELPESLDETYERVLKNINKANQVHAHRLLQCLTVAIRPLHLEEIAEVLALDFDETPGGISKLNAGWHREEQEQAVLSICSGLITIVHDGESRVVQFSHFSVKEFLTSDRLAAAVGDISFHHIPLEPAHTILAQACLGVLLCLNDSPHGTSVQRSPLAEYAAQHYFDHVLFENVSSRVKDGMETLFDPEKPHFSRWIRIYDVGNNDSGLADDEMHPKRLEAALVYYAALCGFRDVVEKLISEYPEHVFSRGGPCGTALHAASRRNHLKVMQLLLEHGAEVGALGKWERTPLHVASRWGHLEIARLLLEHGADVNAKQDEHWTPLHLAAANGHCDLVMMLLRHDADVNARTSYGQTPLHRTSRNGHVDIARLLLDHGADPKARGIYQWTPLHLASLHGKLEVAHLLLERGVDVEPEDYVGNTAYQIALEYGYDKIAQLLSGHGADNKT